MMLSSHNYHPQALFRSCAWVILSLGLLTFPATVLAHAGHGNEFHQSGSDATQIPDSISVDPQISKQLGIKVEPVKAQRLATGIKTTGQIETLPNQKVKVQAPVDGTLVELLVKPGDRVSKGQILAVLSSSELAQLRVESLSKRAEAEADLQQAKADLKLAKENYTRQIEIASAEIAEVKIQLTAAQKQYSQDRELVEARSVVKVATENYQRQIEIAKAEITRAETELAVAQEQYDRDLELVNSGAIARRQMLESRARRAEAQAAVAKAKSRPEVIQAETQIKQAEVDLPLRELRQSQGKVAELKAQLIKVLSRREVLEAENQLKRAESALEIAQSRIELSNSAYEARLYQLGTIANDRGLVTVIAPIDAIVSDREITLGESVKAADKPLMTLLNNSDVFATANIYEKDLDLVKEGQEVRVKVASLPNRTFTGKIVIIGSAVEEETRAVSVQAELNNADGVLKPGLFAELEILTDQTATNILAIPSSAVVDINGRKTVYIQNGDVFQAIEVKLGQISGDLVEIKSGLFEGDLVVTQRAPQLYAQSLRSPGKQSKDEEKKELASNTTAVNLNSFLPPLWLAGAAGGAIFGTVAFSVGVLAGRRQSDRSLERINSDYNTINYETEANLYDRKQTVLPQSILIVNPDENRPSNS